MTELQLSDSRLVIKGLEDMLTAAIGDHGYRLQFPPPEIALLVIEVAKRADDREDWFPRGKWATIQTMQERVSHILDRLIFSAPTSESSPPLSSSSGPTQEPLFSGLGYFVEGEF